MNYQEGQHLILNRDINFNNGKVAHEGSDIVIKAVHDHNDQPYLVNFNECEVDVELTEFQIDSCTSSIKP
jgi:hypothetical protein